MIYKLFCRDSWINKKLEVASKETGYSWIKDWQQSFVNHLYWCAMSTDAGNGAMIRDKWLSLMNHVQNIHSHESELFQNVCMVLSTTEIQRNGSNRVRIVQYNDDIFIGENEICLIMSSNDLNVKFHCDECKYSFSTIFKN